MAEQYFFFNSIEGDARQYGQNEMSLALKYIANYNGISRVSPAGTLQVTILPDSSIQVAAGVMLLEGFVYHLDSALTLPAPSFLQTQPRTDRVIVRLNRAIDTRTIRCQILTGTNGSTAPAALNRSGDIYDMCIALIKWNGSTAVIEDTRADTSVCGFFGDLYAHQTDVATLNSAITALGLAVNQTIDGVASNLSGHSNNKNNPHAVTYQQVGAAASVHNHDASAVATGVLPVVRGGTGQADAQSFRNAMGLGNTTGALPVANGGTGATDAAGARSALGAAGTSAATTSANGLMSSSDKMKLDGVAANANNYTHPNSGATAGTYTSVTVNAQGHVTGGSTPTVPISQGGTGSTTAFGARNALGLGNTIGALPVANGGTGGVTAAEARANLGITPISAGTTDLVAGSSALATGALYFVYE